MYIFMKTDTRMSTPVLSGTKLMFFYGILTLWESPVEDKVVKNFSSSEIKRFLARRDSRGKLILFLTTDPNKSDSNHNHELFLKDSKQNQGLSLLYHLRNAFAHNDIQLSNDGEQVIINHSWKGILKLKTKVRFKILKELIETIRGQHNLTEDEKKKKYTKKKKHK